MKKTIKNISLMLLLVVSILPLSGCGRRGSSDSKSESVETMDNAFDAINELEVEYKEVEYSEEYIAAATHDVDEARAQKYRDLVAKEKTYEITISNPTDHYYNYVPVGFIFDKEKLTQKDLETKDYSMILIPITLAPGDENVIHLTPDTDLDNGDKITMAPYLLPFKESAVGSKVKDTYGSGSKKDSSSDSKDNNKDSNKDKNKDKDSSDSVNNTTEIKSGSSKNDSKDSSKDSDKDSKDSDKDSSKDSSETSERDKKYIQAYISDEKSSQVVYPGDVEFDKPQKEEEEGTQGEGLVAAGYTTTFTNNSDATLKASSEADGANSVMFGILLVEGNSITGLQVTSPERELKVKGGETGELFTVTMGASFFEPKLIFNGYGPAKGASESDSKSDSKDSSKDSDKNKDSSKDSDKNKDKKTK